MVNQYKILINTAVFGTRLRYQVPNMGKVFRVGRNRLLKDYKKITVPARFMLRGKKKRNFYS